MTRVLVIILAVCGVLFAADYRSVYDFEMESIEGKNVSLDAYKGKVLLLVNVASKCGYTPQYAGLQSIYERYRGHGLVIVGIPANNFSGQEPGTNQEIKTFCARTYKVSFPMMAKVSVKGSDQAPLYKYLTNRKIHPKTGGDIQWNFTKFLVDREGKVIARFEPQVKPDSSPVTEAIENALSQK
jgi:glutathione peroxidase